MSCNIINTAGVETKEFLVSVLLLEDCLTTTTIFCFVKVAPSSASESPKDFDVGPSKMGQKDNSKTVSTEALMTVYHPQDAENLDSKMVKR